MSKAIYIYGFHSIRAQLDSDPECILSVLIQSGRDDERMVSLLTLLNKQKIKVSRIEKNKLDRLADNETHQGIIAQIIMPSFPGQEALLNYIQALSATTLILMLDSIQDPRNLGACLRSANAAGVDCVIINKDGSAPFNALVHKASAGALNQVKIFQVTNLVRTIKALQQHGFWVVGLDGETTKSLYSLNLSEPTVLVMGTEGKGIRKLIKKTCDELVKIPMEGSVESLNVSVATGIALFESKRQRQSILSK